MTNPLSIFIEEIDKWDLLENWGLVENSGKFAFNYVLWLVTSGKGALRAALPGKLSVRPPTGVGLDPLEPLEIADPDLGLPSAVNLYLHPSITLPLSEPAFWHRNLDLKPCPLAGLAYLNVATESLEAALGERLAQAVLVGPEDIGADHSPAPSDVVRWLVAGELDISVPSGHPIGNAFHGLTSGPKDAGFVALTAEGPLHPSMIYDHLRDFVADGQAAVDQLVTRFAYEWPLIPGTAIDETRSVIFPWTVLTEFRHRASLTPDQWRLVGNNQKALYRERLLTRFGRPTFGRSEPPFEFNDHDTSNLFQLEAVVEFFANFDDPWAEGATPQLPVDPLEGRAARHLQDDWIQLDGSPDLSAVVPNRHFLYLAASAARPNRLFRITDVQPNTDRVRVHVNTMIPAAGCAWQIDLYRRVELTDSWGDTATAVTFNMSNNSSVIQLERSLDLTRLSVGQDLLELFDEVSEDGHRVPHLITAVDPEQSRVTISGIPTLPGDVSWWRVRYRPVIVIIDPLGTRGTLYGMQATVPNPRVAPEIVHLPEAPVDQLRRINKRFDTIYFASDSRERRAYRIIDVKLQDKSVILDGAPTLQDGHWHIPSGLSGESPKFSHKRIGPGGVLGFDHYDGVLSIIHDEHVGVPLLPWSSFTSRRQESQGLSSIRGNRDYQFSTFKSSSDLRNYSIKIEDLFESYEPNDGIREARFYFAEEVKPDSAEPGIDPGAGVDPEDRLAGKTLIRAHFGSAIGSSGSAGCLVSPEYYRLVDLLIESYQRERQLRKLDKDKSIAKLYGKNKKQAVELYNNEGADGLEDKDWVGKIGGRLWLIRPDERALGR